MRQIKLLLTILLIVPLANCKKDFLVAEPFSDTTVENFYKTAKDAEIALAGCYNVLNVEVMQGYKGGLFFMQMPIMITAGTDELVSRLASTDVDNTPWGLGAWTAGSTFIYDTWFFWFAGINRCNVLLEKINSIEMDEFRKQEIIGEARFLRGMYYLYLGMMYGGVPINTTATADPAAPREPVQKVFEHIFDDLNFAYINLNDRAGITGRANKWAAAGFLAKAYAFAASCKTNLVGEDLDFPLNSFSGVNATEMYNKMLVVTTDIINNSGYKLTTKYDYLFRENTKSYQYEECLFVIEASEDPSNGHNPNYQNGFIPSGSAVLYGGGIGRFAPTGELYEKYNAADARRGWNLTRNYTAASAVELIDGVRYYVPLPIINPKTTAFFTGKFRMMDPAVRKTSTGRTSGNYPLLRYADILLLHAEAVFFTSGNADVARTFLSDVRNRIATSPANLTALNTAYKKTDFVQELLDERTRELCFETQRRFDLTRFGKYTSTINSLTTDNSKGFNNTVVPTLKANWKPYKIWLPVPYTELMLNTNLKQNIGYVDTF